MAMAALCHADPADQLARQCSKTLGQQLLENKGFVSHTAEGKSHRYFPLIGREEYARGVMSSMLSSYFDGSLAQLVSFFSRHENISAREMDEILEIMRNAKK